jgi:triosephosphate isomerase
LKNTNIKWAVIHKGCIPYIEYSVLKKITNSLSSGLNTVICIGEKLNEREEGKTFNVLFNQMETLKKGVTEWEKVVIAYEPVWAIGTGKTASPEQAQEVHFELRKWLRANVSEEVSNKVRIIYGGSVSDGNCRDLIKGEDIDGFLIGGASLKPSFKTIIESII